MSLMILSVSYVYRMCVFVCVLCTVLHHSVQNTEILHVILLLKVIQCAKTMYIFEFLKHNML